MTSRTNASPPAPGGRVSGRLARGEVGFDVEIRTADEARLELSAEGPVGLEVLYELTVDESADLNASVSTRPSEGLAGHLSANAMAALLSAGALEGAAAADRPRRQVAAQRRGYHRGARVTAQCGHATGSS